jgi:hypothetical protein
MSQKSSHVEGDNSSSQTKQMGRFPRSEDGLRSVGSDTEDSSVRQVHDNKDRLNVQYMGSLPHGTDRSELLKQFKARDELSPSTCEDFCDISCCTPLLVSSFLGFFSSF